MKKFIGVEPLLNGFPLLLLALLFSVSPSYSQPCGSACDACRSSCTSHYDNDLAEIERGKRFCV